jgi:hypothetical protein
MNSQSIWQEQRQKMSPAAGTACDNRAPCPVIRASRTGAETFRGLTRVVHGLRAGMWLPDEAEVACTRQPPGWPEQTNGATNGWQVNWLDPDRLRARWL